MAFAKNQQPFDNSNSACIHCGICIDVCPMDVLSFETSDGRATALIADGKSSGLQVPATAGLATAALVAITRPDGSTASML